jgi:5-methyltetrahydrofolate--homocysteine methyltransferase
VLTRTGTASGAFTFPRQRQRRRLCLADFFIRASGLDVIALQLVTVGQPISEYTAKLFAGNNYRDYLEVHGLSVQLTEALAEHWHRRVRSELVLPDGCTLADGPGRPGRHPAHRLPRLPLLLRLSGLSGARRPGQDHVPLGR